MAGRPPRRTARAGLRAAVLGIAAVGVLAVLGGTMLATHGGGAMLTGTTGPAPGSRPAEGVEPVPPGRPARITILGTSLTARGSWPDELARRLAACRPGGVEIRRVARPGASSRWGVRAEGRALTAPDAPPGAPSDAPPGASSGAWRPDILIIEFAINDAALHRGVRLGQSVALHREMIARAGEVPVFLAIMNPVHGIRGWARPGLAAYDATYRQLAAEGRAGLIDTAPAWERLDRAARRRLIPDGLHPGARAMRRVALPVFVAALAPLVCTEPLPPRPQAD